jgi:ABC-type sulfate transport system permease component
MLPEINGLYFSGPAILIIGIGFFALRLRIVREKNPLTKAFRLYALHLAAMSAFLLVVWFTIPIAPVLGTLDYAKSAESIRSPEALASLLQTYNNALARMAAALHWFILVFVAWFLLNTYRFSQTLVSVLSDRAK